MIKKILFILFFVSGFCALLYQMVWLRLAFAAFGINTQVISIVVSFFMLGLALGSWAAGRFLTRLASKYHIHPLYFYAVAEFGIGISAIVVPKFFSLGHNWLLTLGQTNSVSYLSLSAVWLALSILPWCFLMGTTIPLVMEYVNTQQRKDKKIFSYLYLANTFGAIFGTILTTGILIELFGFNNTLFIAAILNFSISVMTSIVAYKTPEFINQQTPIIDIEINYEQAIIPEKNERLFTLGVLFITGFSSMGLELVWNRMFTPLVKTSVYAFATILFLYLLGTCLGLTHYRSNIKKNKIFPTSFILLALAFALLGQIWLNDPRLRLGIYGMTLSILILSYILGYLTPKQIDKLSVGSSEKAGFAYAVNIVGCILGPLFVAYIFLPIFGTKISVVLLSLPLFLFLLRKDHIKTAYSFYTYSVFSVLIGLLALTALIGTTYEENIDLPNKIVKYDYAATVVAFSGDNRDKGLIVNGIPITFLTPITKIMAHLPLALEQSHPKKALVICLGMGTTFRSAMSWGLDTTVVELDPSVKDLLPYFFPDTRPLLENRQGKIVVDDGRRYLQKSNEKFDLIALDPPPPVEAAGSSLLYSKEFYEIAKTHLNEGGILAQWYPNRKDKTLEAVTRSLVEVFPYVQVYQSIEGWGYHFVASSKPIPPITPEQFAVAMPPDAQKDLMEWNDHNDPNIISYAKRILAGKKDLSEFLNPDKNIMVSDDQPYNEYFLVRKLMKTE